LAGIFGAFHEVGRIVHLRIEGDDPIVQREDIHLCRHGVRRRGLRRGAATVAARNECQRNTGEKEKATHS